MNQKEAIETLRKAFTRYNLKRKLHFSEQQLADAGDPDVDMDALRQACEFILQGAGDADTVLEEVGGREEMQEFLRQLPVGYSDSGTDYKPEPPRASTEPPTPKVVPMPASQSPRAPVRAQGPDLADILIVGTLTLLAGMAIGAGMSTGASRRRR
jgi:hypothetical protein